jgi:hypothetical protein
VQAVVVRVTGMLDAPMLTLWSPAMHDTVFVLQRAGIPGISVSALLSLHLHE